MSALPEYPTERDRERFRDITKAMRFGLEYDRRLATNGDYTDQQTVAMFRLWWSVERERQLLQNLNQSQGCKISELAQKLEKAQMEIEALSTENGFVHQHAEEDKQELREHLEVERKRLDWALEHEACFYQWGGVWRLCFNPISGPCEDDIDTTDPRATIDGLIAGEKK
jgi:hypothetical protein